MPQRRRLLELLLGRTLSPQLPDFDPLARYCPHKPWPKQRAFLNLCNQEAFFGGAAAGGKSEALLMAALQFAHVPGYAALIVRKDTQRLRLAGGLIPRSHQWLANCGAKWNGQRLQWSFPTGGAPATISFGYLLDAQDKYRYGSSEYQFIGFDELTEFPEDDYLFLFSRLRKTTDLPVPLRMRSASNPGNLGHSWVKQRFVVHELPTDAGNENDVLFKGEIAYVPARIRDNPAVDEAEYRSTLAHLPPVYRERLMNGDWSVREEGLIRADWLRYFTMHDTRFELFGAANNRVGSCHERDCRRIVTIDPAGTSAEKARERRGRPASWSVIEVWDQPRGECGHFLLLRHVWRKRVGFEGLVRGLREIHSTWRPERMFIENEKLGAAAVDLLGKELPLETIPTGSRDKVARAAPFIAKLERGEIVLPRQPFSWRSDFEAELLAWTGLADEPCDQIDAAAYAVQAAGDRSVSLALALPSLCIRG